MRGDGVTIARRRLPNVLTKSLLVLVGTGLSRGSILIATVLLARLVPSDELAAILFFITSMTVISALVAGGPVNALLRYMPILLPRRPRAAAMVVRTVAHYSLCALAVTGLGVGLFGPVELTQFGGFDPQHFCILLALAIVAQGMTVLALSLLSSLGFYRAQSMLTASGSVLQYAVLVLACVLNHGRWSLAAFTLATLVTMLATASLAFAAVARSDVSDLAGRIRTGPSRAKLGRQIGLFVANTTLAGALFEPVNWINIMRLGKAADPHQVAAFLAANQWFAVILFIPINLAQVSLPIISRSIADSGRVVTAPAVKVFAVNLALGALICGGFLASIGWVVPLYGGAFAADHGVFALTAISGVLVTTQVVGGQVLIAAGLLKTNLTLNAVWAATYLVLAGHPAFQSAAGLAEARLWAYALHACLLLTVIAVADWRLAGVRRAAP